MSLPANIRVNVRVPFPALVQGGAFVGVNKANGIWTVAPDYTLLAQAPAITPTQLIAVYDSASKIWSTVTATELEGGGGGGAGALLAANNLSDVASKSTSFNNLSPMTTPGDIIYGGASGAGTRLPPGTSSQVLYGGTTPSWGPPGVASVNSVTALKALAFSPTALVYLSAGGLSGTFVFSSANLSTQVTNDPGQAIYVAPASAPTGASGAWVRQFARSNLAWWGIISDPTFASAPAIAANSAALANYGTWARYWSTTLGGSAATDIPDGDYPFDNALCQRWYAGIARLHWRGYGATFQNVTTNASWQITWEFPSLPIETGAGNLAWLIDATTVGATSFKVSTPANAANLAVGQLVGLGSLDVAYFGFPPSIYDFEITRITAINTSTGVVNVDRPIRFAHLTTYPDGVNSPQAGKARVWQLNTVATINGITQTITFDVTHVIEGVTILPNSNGPQGDMNMDGRSITWENAKINNITPSIACENNIIGCQVGGDNNLIDKLVESFNIERTEVLGTMQITTNCNDRVSIAKCKIGTLFTGGKVCSVTDTEVQQLFVGGPFGASVGTVIDGCTVRQYTPRVFAAGATNGPTFGNITATAAASWAVGATTLSLASNPGGITAGMIAFDTTTGLPVDLVSSVSGTTVTLQAPAARASSGASDGLLFGNIVYWKGVITQAFAGAAFVGLQPGNALMLAGPSGAFTGDFGTMFIVSITGDGTFMFAQTTYQAVSLPTWAPGPSYLQQVQQLTVRNSTGCDGIRRAREATSAGLQEGQLIKDTFFGEPSTSGGWKLYGVPTSIAVTVAQVSALTTPKFIISGFLNTANNPAATTVQIILTIDLLTPGTRTLTAAGFTALGADTLTYNGSPVTAIPANVIWSGNFTAWQFSPAPSGGTQLQQAIVDVDMKMDTGLFFRAPTSQFDGTGSLTTFEANVTGSLI